MPRLWFYPALSFFFIVSFSFAPQAISGTGDPAKKQLPLLAANLSRAMVQVSSFRAHQEAEDESARLNSLGVEALIQYESVPGKGYWYRVYAGQFKTESQARKYANSLKDKGIISWFWVKTVRLPPPAKTVESKETRKTPVKSKTSDTKEVAREAPSLQKNELTLPAQEKQTPSPVIFLATTVAVKSEVPNKVAPPVSTEDTRQTDEDPVPDWGVRIKSQTTLRAFERDTSNGQDTMVAPLYQYLQVDYGDAEAGGWAMHFYGWGRYDMADSAYFENSAEGRLLYGYLEYSKPYSAYRLTLGRQQIFAGVTNDVVDGIQVSAGVGQWFSTNVFGGVTAGSTESSADMTYGTRLALHPQPHYEFAISYQNTDLEGLPDHRVGGDLFFNWRDRLTIQGLSSYNIDSEDWREHNYSAAMRYKDFILEPAYHFFSYADYFGVSKEKNNLFTFLKDTEEQVTIVGGDIQYQGDLPVRLGGRYNQYAYDLRQENAAYYAALVSVDFSGGSQLGGEAGRMDGETADNIYNLYRAYFYWDNPFRLKSPAFVSGDAVFQNYDAPVFGEDSATHYSLSGGMHFFDDALEVKLTGLYSQDPYFDENVEGMLTFRINY